MKLDGNFEVSVVGDVATAKLADSTAFVTMAKDAGIEKDTLVAVEKFTKGYLDAAGTRVASESEEYLKKNKNVASVVYEMPFGTKANDGVYMTVTREKTYKQQFGADAGKEITKSTIRTAVEASYMKPTASMMKEHEKALTTALLG